jgi:predicted nucleotidyltransferase
MLNQSQVDAWLGEFVRKLKDRFKERLLFAGHIGSWARGEARPESDIDCLVVIDKIGSEDIKDYRTVLGTMPDFDHLGGGILVSLKELSQTPAFHLVQLFFNGCKVLYGSVESILTRPSTEDYLTDIKMKTCDNLHIARHHILFSQDLSGAASGLKFNFYNCFFALQNWIFVTRGRFIATKSDILAFLDDPVDKEVVRIARDWYKLTDDLTARPFYYIELLERWGRGMAARLEGFSVR